MTVEKPSCDNIEALKVQSWEEILGLYRESVTTVYGKELEPFIGIIETLIKRGINTKFFASQSHGRFVLGRLASSSLEGFYQPHILATLNQHGKIEVELCHIHERGYYILRKGVCVPSAAADAIVDFVKELSRIDEVGEEK